MLERTPVCAAHRRDYFRGGTFRRDDGLVARSAAGALRRHQISAHHPAHHRRQRASQRHARAVAGIEHPIPAIVFGHFDELHCRGGDSRRVQPGDGVHDLERAADVAASRLRRDYSFIKLANVAVIAFAGTTGNVRLFQMLARLGGSKAVAFRVLVAWLAGNLFLGSQLSGFCGRSSARPICRWNFSAGHGLAREFLRKCFPFTDANPHIRLNQTNNTIDL